MADLFEHFGAEDEEEEEVQEESASQIAVFLLDAKAFFKSEATFKRIKEAVVKKVLHLGFLSASCKVGVVLYGTSAEKGWTENASDEYVYWLADVAPPTIASVQDFYGLSLEEDKQDIFGRPAADAAACGLKNACMTAASRIAAVKGKTKAVPTTVIITDDPDPMQGSDDFRESITKVLEDLRRSGFVLVCSAAERPGALCEAPAFWASVQRLGDSEARPAATATDLTAASLLTLELDLQQRWPVHKAPAARRALLHLSSTMTLPVKVLSLSSARKPITRYKYVDKTTQEELATSSALLDPETGGVLAAADVAQAALRIKDGFTSLVVLPRDAASDLRAPGVFGERHPSLTIREFRPASQLSLFHQTSQATKFVTFDASSPSADSAADCQRLFVSLWVAMQLNPRLEHPVMALAAWKATAAAVPRLVALRPVDAQHDATGRQVQPAGFTLHFLPYTDEVRLVAPSAAVLPPTVLPKVRPARATEAQIDAAGALVDALMDRSVTRTTLPSAEASYQAAALESQVLGLAEPAPRAAFNCSLSYLAERMKAAPVALGVVQRFEAVVLHGRRTDPEAEAAGKKRGRGDGGSAAATGMSDADIVAHTNWGKLKADCKLKDQVNGKLQAYLRHHGLRASGNKKELIARVEQHLASQK